MNTKTAATFTEQLATLAGTLFEPDDVVELRYIDRTLPADHKNKVRSTWHHARDIPKLSGLESINSGGADIYFGVNPRKGFNQRGDESVAIARCLFCEFDAKHTGTNEREEAISRVWSKLGACMLPTPTLIGWSGHGVWCFWRMSEPSTDLAWWTERQKDLINAVGSDATIHNPERIARLLGLTNHKPPVATSEIIDCDATRVHDWADVLGVLPERIEEVKESKTFDGDVTEGARHGTILSMAANMRNLGLSAAEMMPTLLAFNQSRCKPPKPDIEVENVATWAELQKVGHARTPKGNASEADTIHFNAISRCMADVVEKDLPWLWKGFIPDCNITVVSGRGGVGKGYWWADFVSRVTTDGKMPDWTVGKTGPVILAIAEDSHEYTVKSRLRVNGCDLSRVHTIEGLKRVDETGEELEIAFTLEHVAALEREVQRVKPTLVIVDPIGSFIGGKTEANADNAVRAILTPLAMMAEKYAFACVVVAHHRKSAGESADDLVLSSRAFTAAARASFHIFDDDGRKMFLRGKGNLSRHRHGMAYRIEDVGDKAGRVKWEAEAIDMTADDYLEQASKPGMDAESRDDAAKWLRDTLGDSTMTKSELQDRRNKDGVAFSWRTAQRAMKHAKVKCERDPHTNKYVYRMLRDGNNQPQAMEEAADE